MVLPPVADTGNGPAIVALHGWGQTGRSFAPLARALADGFRVISFDFPGHGTAKDVGGPYTFKRYAEFVGEMVSSLKLERFHLLGWSMGGTVGSIYTNGGFGPKPDSLIMLSATPKFVIPEKNLGIGQHPAAVKKMERMIKADHDAGLRDFIGRLFASGETIAPELTPIIEDAFFGGDFPPLKEALLSTLSDMSQTDLTEGASISPLPVLIICGGADKINPVGGQKLWRSVFRDLREVFLDGAGHAPHLTRTADTAEAVRVFLSSLE